MVKIVYFADFSENEKILIYQMAIKEIKSRPK